MEFLLCRGLRKNGTEQEEAPRAGANGDSTAGRAFNWIFSLCGCFLLLTCVHQMGEQIFPYRKKKRKKDGL